MEKQRFGHEQNGREQNPYQNHCVHPPVVNAREAIPEILEMDDQLYTASPNQWIEMQKALRESLNPNQALKLGGN